MRASAITITLLLAGTLLPVAKADDTPQRSPGLQALDRFVGTWDIQLTVKPAGGDATRLDALSIRKWSEGGKFVVFDDPQGEGLVIAITHDPGSNTYPGVMMSGVSRGLVTGTWDEGAKTMHFVIDNTDGTVYRGSHRFLRDDYAEASGKITSAAGDVLMELSFKQTLRKEIEKPGETITDKIVAKHLEAIGGVKAYEKLKSLKMEGTITGLGEPWKITTVLKAPDKSHSRIEIPGVGVMEEGCDGKVAWKKGPGQPPLRLGGYELTQELWEARMLGAIELMTEGKLTYEGRKELDGRACHVFKVAYEKGPSPAGTCTVYIDAKNHLMARMEIPMDAEGVVGEIALQFGDYRAVAGAQLACSVGILLGGNSLMKVEVDKVTCGVEVGDDLFAMPTE